MTIHSVVDLVEISMERQYDGLEDVAMPFVINISTVDLVKPDLFISMTSGFGNISTMSTSVTIIENEIHSLQFEGDWDDVEEALSLLVYIGDVDWNGFDDELVISVNITSTGQVTTDQTTVFLDAVNDPIIVSDADALSYTVWEDEVVLYCSESSCSFWWKCHFRNVDKVTSYFVDSVKTSLSFGS